MQGNRRSEKSQEAVTEKHIRLLPLIFALILILDQLTKFIALQNLLPGRPVTFLGDFLRWTLVFNPGGAFSMRLGSSDYYLVASIIIFVALIFYIIRNRKTAILAVPLTIVAGGAAGNIIDRLRFGKVIDFIDCEFFDISIGSYHMDRWPIFNIADMAVSCGIISVILLTCFHNWKNNRRSTPIASDKITQT